jgi:hypothetical protein
VALVEPTRHLGGMTTRGLGWVDVKVGGVRAFGGLTGEYYRRVREYYAARGIDVAKFGNDGAVAEPHVAEADTDTDARQSIGGPKGGACVKTIGTLLRQHLSLHVHRCFL